MDAISNGFFKPYEEQTDEELRAMGAVYEKSIIDFREHERQGHWFASNGQWYPNGDVHAGDVRGWKYDATEDLAFLFTELGTIWRLLHKRADERWQEERHAGE
jgi:hypothetical protein